MTLISDDDLDFDNRRLCPDESCIGVIGDDGVCGECGRPAEGVEVSPLAPTVEERKVPMTGELADPVVVVPGENAAEENDDDRRLCPDGNCIGLIGPDGKCKICGAPSS